ncbi:MAG: right-handed parallel beta-helix repeat-containing protein [Nitriliruptoraceae bacterium]|nr:right-handed parallel beta-helix repeat-containing protein [Nitriliruptoraceae bacterium]
MRRRIPLYVTMIGAMTLAIVPAAAADDHGPVSVTAGDGFTCDADLTYRTISVDGDDVTIDGCTFDGGSSTGAAIRNSGTGFDNLTITDNTFTGYTGRTITLGFAEGVSLAGFPASNVTISGNTLDDMVGNDTTSIAVFNTDGVVISDNEISNADSASTVRRGINLDGSRDVLVQSNTINLGAEGDLAFWGIQVSMSDREAERITISDNELSGADLGIIGLSQRDVTDLLIEDNVLTETRIGVALNVGAPPVENLLTYRGIDVRENAIGSSQFGILFFNANTEANEVVFEDVIVCGNEVTGGAGEVSVGADLALINVDASNGDCPGDAPQSADDCRRGGFANFDFRNQGLCIASIVASDLANTPR